MKYLLYNGLFLNLPFEDVRTAGVLLPLFIPYCKRELEKGRDPVTIITNFFAEQKNYSSHEKQIDELFRFMRLVERQVVLFDAVEDAAFTKIRDINGPGSLADLFHRIQAADKTAAYREFLEQFQVRMVLTAHPTQFYTDEVLTIITDLAQALEANDLPQIHSLLLQMGQTRFKNPEKPTPRQEAEGLLWVLENVLYSVVPRINQALCEAAWVDEGWTPQRPSPVELGFWPGGDRDGNPNVLSETTREVGEMLRASILQRYLDDLRTLRRRLTFGGITDKLKQIEQRLSHTLHPFSDAPLRADAGMFCIDPSDDNYIDPAELVADLQEVRRIIVEDYQSLFVDLLDNFMYRVHSFGFHFASMDIRQDSRIHEAFWDEFFSNTSIGGLSEGLADSLGAGQLSAPSWKDTPEAEKVAILRGLISSLQLAEPQDRAELGKRIVADLEERGKPILADCLGSLFAVRHIQERNGSRGAKRYVISNTQSVSDILEVLAAKLLAGFEVGKDQLNIIPLFETVPDLEGCGAIMSELYSLPEYMAHLQNHGFQQVIMLGFSDGTKDGGYVTANWRIYRAKEELTRIARQNDISVHFFDGRGGPPARGGGSSHKFYRSFSPEIENRSIQVTVQGQTITSLYGTPASASYNLAQLVSAGIENRLFPREQDILSDSDRALLDALSTHAHEAYSALKAHKKFVPYLEKMTPLTYYGRTNIGSRPSKRSSSTELRLEDLRAIPFVGAWSQTKQNVPGFFGFGSGLRRLRDQGHEDDLRDLARRSLFVRTLMENTMQSLSKVNYDLTRYQAKDPEFGDFWSTLAEEQERTKAELLRLTDQKQLLDHDPMLRDSINLRENMILPCMVIQQYALLKINEIVEDSKSSQQLTLPYEKLILKSIAASINASRNAV